MEDPLARVLALVDFLSEGGQEGVDVALVLEVLAREWFTSKM